MNLRIRSLAVVALTVFATILSTTPAMAATCVAAGCDGKDPNTAGCSAVTLAKDLYGTELRYSAACNAFWARNSYYNNYYYENYSVERRCANPSICGNTVKFMSRSATTSPTWTNMLGKLSYFHVRVCTTIFDGGGSTWTSCTVFYT